MKDIVRENIGLIAAAEKLERIGQHHGWFPKTVKTLRNLDPIGQDEFLDTVSEIITTYQRAYDGETPPDAFATRMINRFRQNVLDAPEGAYPSDTVAWARDAGV